MTKASVFCFDLLLTKTTTFQHERMTDNHNTNLGFPQRRFPFFPPQNVTKLICFPQVIKHLQSQSYSDDMKKSTLKTRSEGIILYIVLLFCAWNISFLPWLPTQIWCMLMIISHSSDTKTSGKWQR